MSGHRYCLRVAPSVMDTFSAVETVKQQLMMYKKNSVTFQSHGQAGTASKLKEKNTPFISPQNLVMYKEP